VRALVTGATGTIGPFLVNYLASKGHHVRILLRSSMKPPFLCRNIDYIHGDIRDSKCLAHAIHQADVVFHLAAKLHINNPQSHLADEYQQINIDGSANVAKAVVESNVKRMVHFSTINVYGPSCSLPPFNENSRVNPLTIYAQTKVKAEKAVRDIFERQKSSSFVILRLASVYGPKMQGNYQKLVKALKYRCFWPIGTGDNRRTLIYIDDLVRGACLASEHPNAAGETYNITDGRIYTLAEIIHAISRSIGRNAPRFHIPKGPALMFAAIADKTFSAIDKPQVNLGLLLQKLLEDVAVNGDKINRDIGFRSRVSLKLGWQKAISG
jgi:UDP-N-acetyl-alpha-D-quinovosamine dehydrogenase